MSETLCKLCGEPHPTGMCQHQEKIAFDRFREIFKHAEIHKIAYADIPDYVRDFLEGQAQKFIDPENYRIGNFSDTFQIDHKNADRSFVARTIKTFSNPDATEDSIYVADTREDELIGYAEIRYNHDQESPFFRDKPFVGITRTTKHPRTGLGTRRIEEMNALTEMIYDQPLYSDTTMTEEAVQMWEKLVDNGNARKFNEGTRDRYVYVKSPL